MEMILSRLLSVVFSLETVVQLHVNQSVFMILAVNVTKFLEVE